MDEQPEIKEINYKYGVDSKDKCGICRDYKNWIIGILALLLIGTILYFVFTGQMAKAEERGVQIGFKEAQNAIIAQVMQTGNIIFTMSDGRQLKLVPSQ